MKQFATIDIGSNAIRFGVAEVSKGNYEWINRYRVPLRLGAEVFSNKKKISDNTMSYAVDAFNEFYRLMEEYEVSKYFCGATSAFREAKNNKSFKAEIEKKTGIEITGISGDEEAQIAMLGISKFLDKFKAEQIHHFLLADLGGGSLELDIIEGRECLKRKSFKIGTVRMLNLYKEFGRESTEVKEYFDEQFDKIEDFLNLSKDASIWNEGKCTIVGIGGNFRRLSKLKNRIFEDGNDFVSYEQVEQILNHDYLHRIKQFGLKPDRADVIVPALDIIKRLTDSLPVEKIYAPVQGLIDGLMLNLIENKSVGIEL
jgi:exopolyphosphatase/guanosine-5'-triphosphate,3'-diphosphate pyrophosphatase